MAEATTWWQTLRLRDEVSGSSGVDDTVASLYRVVYGKGVGKPRYANADYYGQITYPTDQLVELLARIAIRLGGGNRSDRGYRLVRLDQGMGGGKSHACIGAWHLATAPEVLTRQDIGRAVFAHARDMIGYDLPADLNQPHAVVLSCDNMTPGVSEPDQDGPWSFNLFERFLWRLFAPLPDRERRYEEYKAYFSNKAKIAEAIQQVGRPVLIIVDEIVNYIGDGLEGTDNEKLKAQDMAFLRNITEAVSDVPNAVMVVVMISSEKDQTTLQGEGDSRRQDLEAYLQRNGRPMVVNENADFTAILRRRLFDVVDQQAFQDAVTAAVDSLTPVFEHDSWRTKVIATLGSPWTRRFAEEVQRTFPFHPQLMDLAEREWANLAAYQQVRSTIKIFAATVSTLVARAEGGEWVPPLIGAGDLPLSDERVREAVLDSGLVSGTKTRTNYRSIAVNDVVDLDDVEGAARRLDRFRSAAPWQTANPRAAERAATLIFLTSIVGTRGGGTRRGASDPEVKAAMMVPDNAFGYNDADAIVRALCDSEGTGLACLEVYDGKGGQPRRYFLSANQQLPMLFRAMRNTVTDIDRDDAIAERTAAMLRRGYFAQTQFVAAEHDSTHRDTLVHAGLDKARTTRLIVLDPAMFTIGNGTQQPTLDAVRALLGLGPNPVLTAWASSMVFLVCSARSRALARKAAADYLAYERVLDGPEVESDDDLHAKATEQRDKSRKRLDEYVSRGFQHVLFLAQPDPAVEREVEQRNLEEGTLDGTKIWDLLAQVQKAFPKDKFTGRALLHNLRENDYGRPLPEIRDAFWNTPRLALLPAGEADLKIAIHEAVVAGELRIIRAADEDVVVDDPANINLNAPTYRLAKSGPKPTKAPKPGKSAPLTKKAPTEGGSGSGEPDDQTGPGEQILGFTAMKNLTTDPDASELLAQVFRRLFDALDRRSMSYVQFTIQAHMPPEQVEEIRHLVGELGIPVNVRNC